MRSLNSKFLTQWVKEWQANFPGLLLVFIGWRLPEDAAEALTGFSEFVSTALVCIVHTIEAVYKPLLAYARS